MNPSTIYNCILLQQLKQEPNNVTDILLLTLLIVFFVYSIYITITYFKSKAYKNKNEINKLKSKILKTAQEEANLIKKVAKEEKQLLLKKYIANAEIIEIKENELNNLIKQNEYVRDNLNKKENEVNDLRVELDSKIRQSIQLASENAYITESEAKNILLDMVKVKYEGFLKEQVDLIESKWKLNAKEKTRSILLNMLTNISTDIVYQGTTTVFKLDSNEEKGKIIGKDGRNLKAIQQILGVDVVLNYSNDEILISSFDPIRRLVASKVIQNLLDKKRLQPQAIEEEVEIIKSGLETEFYNKGLSVANENNIFDLPDKLLTLLGTLEYRTSYGQSVLRHSVEVGQICSLIAKEINLDEKLAFKCGLLHDIGKAVDRSQEGTHVKLGVDILKSLDFDPIIINSVESHHEDVHKESVYAEIVAIADAISASRPGARNVDLDVFIERMKEIEKSIKEFAGVKEVYALRSGRQIRVIVDPQLISDVELAELAVKTRDRIFSINTTPGEIFITIIREKRHVLKL